MFNILNITSSSFLDFGINMKKRESFANLLVVLSGLDWVLIFFFPSVSFYAVGIVLMGVMTVMCIIYPDVFRKLFATSKFRYMYFVFVVR